MANLTILIVTQKTLYEDSINFLPNWFGRLVKTACVVGCQKPLLHTKCLEMDINTFIIYPSLIHIPLPMTDTINFSGLVGVALSDIASRMPSVEQVGNIKDGESWITPSWHGKYLDDDDDSLTDGSLNGTVSLGSFVMSNSYEGTLGDDESSLDNDVNNYYSATPVQPVEHIVEIGKLRSTTLNIGESISRVHYLYTSNLAKSQWRRKYFLKGTYLHWVRDLCYLISVKSYLLSLTFNDIKCLLLYVLCGGSDTVCGFNKL